MELPSWRLFALLSAGAIAATIAAAAGSVWALLAWPFCGLIAALLLAGQGYRRPAAALVLGCAVAVAAAVAVSPWLLLALWPPLAVVFGLLIVWQSKPAEHRGRRRVPSPAAAAPIRRPDRRPPR